MTDPRVRLLDDLGAAGPGGDRRLLRGSVCAFLECQLGSGRLFSVVAERRESVGRLWLHATSCGRRIYEAAGFEARSVEEMRLVLSG